ncbi:NAD-dependent protein deacylase [Bacilliculturomica massiliensis]|uniref:NAD-dependent protein deacylase n=1 Tax=Bacilliculturomica massiliensis TaxID=1917867 RepID=UPI001031E070|nr:NAD-dependent protein deacylase [Bacilliculturomica massiliensis]
MYEELKKILEESKKIVFFGGAGVSTESGVPDFRSESGLYQAQSRYGYSPEHMLSRTFYEQSTETFFDYYKNNLIYREARPNKAHLALARLEQEGKLLAVVTQNIDGLHQLAGSKRVYELHGSVLRNTCTGCGAHYELDYIMDQENCSGWVPKCAKCGATVKPDVVLYEECLDDSCINGAVNAIARADTLIVGGTSLVVYPAAGLIQYFRGKHLVLINKSKTQYDGKADLVISDAIGEVLGECVL